MIRKIEIILALLLLIFSSVFADEIVIPEKLFFPRQAPVVSEMAQSYLLTHKTENGTIKIWVYFTDKGATVAQAYLLKAESARQALTPKTQERRLRNGVAGISYIDLPVEARYVEQVKALGAKPRQVSKWLNAASFEITSNQLPVIAGLPFVRKIEPVIIYQRKNEPLPVPIGNKNQPIDNSLNGKSLSYGSSYDQLNQINAVAAHNAGYSGAGVWVAMFDTGFRKSHAAFANILSEGRLIAEHDFVFNDGETANESQDYSSAWDHGTMTWSTLGGNWSGQVYGPAYGASFVLCKTEDIRSETQVEEDNWVAAVEWVDSIGVDVISSSLGYSDWYTPPDYDGNTCVGTIAADHAAALGIVVCNSAGNDGPGASTLGAPADADSIITVGAVNSSGSIAYFSSRGPTYDGRTKPEVCARGVSTYCAGSSGDTYLTTASGTSLSCPLIGGAAALIIQAHPDWTVMQVREAMMMTASRAGAPDNTYGWGIINIMDAINYSFTPEPQYQKGDANHDSVVNVSDAVYLINYVFNSGAEPIPVLLAGDANNDGIVNVSDATFIINYVFIPGSPPPPGLNGS